ncbi:N-6 DNA methylase [Streptomyces sp. NPDC012888]|uniref:N-6 DNA methylase n=1 Tax=Streptomyces sp. NPDC012888 TaxID=3364855 RepID=UPI00369875E4
MVRELMGPLADQVRGAGTMVDYAQLLVALHFLRGASDASWQAVRAHAREAAGSAAGGAAGELLEEIGRAVDQEVKRLGMMPYFTESLSQLTPRSAGHVAHVVDLVGKLDGNDAFQLIIDEYETHARLRSREFFTPRGVVRLMGALARTSFGKGAEAVYDPYVRGGEFLAESVAAARLIRQRRPDLKPLRVFGQTTRREAALLASLNLALHGVRSGVRLADEEPWRDRNRAGAGWADLVLTNPPFNMKDSSGQARRTGTWAYGPPPLDNDNFAYLQHVLASLREGGRAAVVMPNKAGNSGSAAERAIRRAMVEAGVVECIIALPAKLFSGTAVPVSVWLLRHPSDPHERVVFLDARHLGTKKGPRRTLEEEDLRAVLGTYRAQAGYQQPALFDDPEPEWGVPHATVDRDRLLKEDCSLNPLDHITPSETPDRKGGADEDALWLARDELTRLVEHSGDADAHAASMLREVTPDPGARETTRWRTAKLAQLCDMKAGPSYSRLGGKDRAPGGVVPVVFPKHLREGRVTDTGEERVSWELAKRLPQFTLEAGDILCVRSGKTKPPALVTPDQSGWLMSPNVIRLRPREAAEVDPAYLLNWLHREEVRAWVTDRAAATAAPSISVATLGRLEVRLPPLPEQRRIAAVLQSLDEQARTHQQLAAAAARTRALLAEQVMNPEPPPATGTTAP